MSGVDVSCVCSRWDIVVSTHITEVVRQLPPTGPARSSDEPSHPIELCRAAEAQEAIAAASGSSGSTVATGDAVTFAAIGLHDYTMQKRLDSDRAHQQPDTKCHGNFHDNERRTKALMDELQKIRTRRDAQTAVPNVWGDESF